MTQAHDIPDMDELARLLSQFPTAIVEGVTYVLDYGEGWAMELTPWGKRRPCPLFVWRATCDLSYTAPAHVADAAYEYLRLGEEVAMLEQQAGWDPNP